MFRNIQTAHVNSQFVGGNKKNQRVQKNSIYEQNLDF